ncbi:DUF6789 family protein [Sphaerisporangium rubeum]|uniref:DUF1440 domain-containing protein n=1 Tax=Sphaerisporangium rubeum TaxID=321317 RepID=A0A7X0MAY9_9ACTN|nr:DUF6789 family protein [Sphaerisporangium rubeum]MBB6476584.1 hypothetical protein [Sphaerisporangium rubeum]
MIRDAMQGALSGVLATAVMSAAMVAGERAGLMKGGQPPRRIVRAVLPGHDRRPKAGEGLLGAVAHVGFGATAGALFSLLADRRHARLPTGVVYGLAIWGVSYQGWVPKLGVVPPIHRDRPERQAVMAAAHVVYGATLVAGLNRLRAGTLPTAPEPEEEPAIPAGETLTAH